MNMRQLLVAAIAVCAIAILMTKFSKHNTDDVIDDAGDAVSDIVDGTTDALRDVADGIRDATN